MMEADNGEEQWWWENHDMVSSNDINGGDAQITEVTERYN